MFGALCLVTSEPAYDWFRRADAKPGCVGPGARRL